MKKSYILIVKWRTLLTVFPRPLCKYKFSTTVVSSVAQTWGFFLGSLLRCTALKVETHCTVTILRLFETRIRTGIWGPHGVSRTERGTCTCVSVCVCYLVRWLDWIPTLKRRCNTENASPSVNVRETLRSTSWICDSSNFESEDESSRTKIS